MTISEFSLQRLCCTKSSRLQREQLGAGVAGPHRGGARRLARGLARRTRTHRRQLVPVVRGPHAVDDNLVRPTITV